jgi:hypothetical protein
MNHLQLKTAIAGWLKRSDMADIIPTLVQLAEARLSRELRLRCQLVIGTITASGESIALPAGWLEFKALVYSDNSATKLNIGTVEQVMTERARIGGARPSVGVVTGDALQLGPVTDSSYLIQSAYYAKFTALAGDADTNWLLTNHPGVYLWAALAEASPWMVDDQRVATWEAKLGQDMTTLKMADRAAEFSGSALEFGSINTQAVV